MERALLQIQKVKFIKKYCLECSTTYVEAEQLWNRNNDIDDDSDDNYDSDNGV